jgi:integrase
MNSITTDEFERYTEKRQLEGAANASIRRELSIVKRAYKLAMKARLLMHMPHIPMPGSDKDNIRTGFFEREQFERVRDYLPVELRGISTMAYLVGWRVPSELFPLRWRQVDRKAKVIRLDPGTTKNGRGRLLPYKMLPELAEVIENAWQYRKDVAKKNGELPAPENDWVFHRDGNPIKSMKGAWKSACEKAGCPEMLMHDMRRSAVRNLVRAGVTERVSMEITGHLTRDIFDRYDIVNESDLENALGRLDDEGGPILGQSAVFSGKEAVESSRIM